MCKCFGVDAALIERTVRDNALKTMEQVTCYTKAGGGCQTCHEKIEEILMTVNGSVPVAAAIPAPATVPASKPAPMAPATKKMTNLQKINLISRVIEDIRPQLQRDGGDVDLVDVDGDTVYISMTGMCASCQMSAVTVTGIQERLIAALGRPLRVVPVQRA